MPQLEDLALAVECAKRNGRRTNEIIHVWLEGFGELMRGAHLAKGFADKYLVERMGEYLPFTILQSSAFLLTYHTRIRGGEIGMKQLVVDNNYHLQFPLKFEGGAYTFMITPCSLRLCHHPRPHSLPIVELRKSQMMGVDVEQAGGSIMYDNRLHPQIIKAHTVYDSYKALDEFINKCSN
jgi:hypothetical protein